MSDVIELNAPENSAKHITWQGQAYQVKDGVVNVPRLAFGELRQHGFTWRNPPTFG